MKNAPPAGWFDDGSQYYIEAPKERLITYRIRTNGSQNDSTAATYRVGSITLDGALWTVWNTGEIGTCPISKPYVLKGIGGTTTGTYNIPCA